MGGEQRNDDVEGKKEGDMSHREERKTKKRGEEGGIALEQRGMRSEGVSGRGRYDGSERKMGRKERNKG